MRETALPSAEKSRSGGGSDRRRARYADTIAHHGIGIGEGAFQIVTVALARRRKAGGGDTVFRV